MKRKIESSGAPFSSCMDRFVTSYRDGISTEELWDEFGKIDAIDGIGVMVPLEFESVGYIKNRIKALGKEISTVCPDTYMNPILKDGMLMSRDPGLRRESVALVRQAMDVCHELDGADILLWLAHDGYDYPFEDDYSRRMDFLMESLDEICRYRKDVKVTIEYKAKEPRTYQYISNLGKSLFICERLGLENLGVVVDIGHALLAHENPAESIALAAKYGKLFHVHLNDNYRSWDDDLVMGSVHFWEVLECLWQMDKVGYNGWLNLDIWPTRIDGKGALLESIKRIRMFERLAATLPKEEILRLQHENKTAEIMEILRKTCIKDEI
mgnify:CR=1 FL=1